MQAAVAKYIGAPALLRPHVSLTFADERVLRKHASFPFFADAYCCFGAYGHTT